MALDPRRPSNDPANNKVWTITLPDGSGFDVIVANTYESHSGIARLCELAGVEAYASDAPASDDDDRPPIPSLVLIVGNPGEGFTFYGPYANGDDVDAEHRDLRNNYWWLAEIQPPLPKEPEHG